MRVTVNKIPIKLEKETLLFCVLVVWMSLKISYFILGEINQGSTALYALITGPVTDITK